MTSIPSDYDICFDPKPTTTSGTITDDNGICRPWRINGDTELLEVWSLRSQKWISQSFQTTKFHRYLHIALDKHEAQQAQEKQERETRLRRTLKRLA
ncbi:MAG: hypothetical protein HC920_11115 [Oscillatoriales cyanobacterium SM2_3_0]|nr:hypothetical protein [Oscillatoriales cyanobacterium SM2_3_0]